MSSVSPPPVVEVLDALAAHAPDLSLRRARSRSLERDVASAKAGRHAREEGMQEMLRSRALSAWELECHKMQPLVKDAKRRASLRAVVALNNNKANNNDEPRASNHAPKQSRDTARPASASPTPRRSPAHPSFTQPWLALAPSPCKSPDLAWNLPTPPLPEPSAVANELAGVGWSPAATRKGDGGDDGDEGESDKGQGPCACKQEDTNGRVLVDVEWRGEAQHVSVRHSGDGWRTDHALHPNNTEHHDAWHATLAFASAGAVEFKFVADGMWTLSPHYAIAHHDSFSNNTLVPFLVEWDQGGGTVQVCLALDQWKARRPLVFCRRRRVHVLRVVFPTAGKHAFKFVVDGEWRLSGRYQQDREGEHVNNVLWLK